MFLLHLYQRHGRPVADRIGRHTIFEESRDVAHVLPLDPGEADQVAGDDLVAILVERAHSV